MDPEDINSRINEMESRIARIEMMLHISPKAPTTTTQPVVNRNISVGTKESALNWLGIVGILCFMIAAGFIIKLSIDTGWLTPAKQIGLATLLGFSLIGVGVNLLKTDKAYASLLPAAGIVILYCCAFAAHDYYALISFSAAITLTSVISVMSILLYKTLKHDLYAIIATLGAYLAPIFLDLNGQVIFSIYYYLICSLTFAALAIWLQSRLIIVLAAYLAVFVNAYIGFNLNMESLVNGSYADSARLDNHLKDELIAIILPIHFLIFVLSSYLYSIYSGKELTREEAWNFFPVLLVFYSIEYYFLFRMTPQYAPWISLSFVGLLYAVYLSSKTWLKERSVQSQPMIFAFIAIVLFHSVYLELLPDNAKPWLFVLAFVALAIIPRVYLQQNSIKAWKIPLLTLCVILAIEYTGMVFRMLDTYNAAWILVTLASVASMWLFFIKQHRLLVKDEYNYLLLSAAHLLAITAFYRLTTAHGSLAVSAAWLLYAIVVIAFAFIRKDKIMANSALFILAFAAGKAFLYDVASAPTVVRILCLLLTGVVLYGSGLLIKKMGTWK